MELDQLKETWQEMSVVLEKQKLYEEQALVKMVHQKTKNRLSNIILLEKVGIAVSILAIAVVVYYFDRLISSVAVVAALLTLLTFVVGIFFSFKIIMGAKKIDVIHQKYAETIEHFKNFKAIMKLLKKVTLVIYAITPFIVIPVTLEMVHNKDITEHFPKMLRAVGISLVLLPLVWYVFFRFYSKNIKSIGFLFQKLKK